MDQLDPTLELHISFDAQKNQKQAVIAWLKDQGENNFVEGAIDGLDLFEYEHLDDAHCPSYEELGGENTALCLYKYSEAEMQRLEQGLKDAFGHTITVRLNILDTASWQHGWKESFRPIYTDRFCVHPPWDRPEEMATRGLFPIEIDPGMAFGTGQHATTQLCLKALERLGPAYLRQGRDRVLDVGTGSGVLAIAAYKLGFRGIAATDIDADAMTAAKRNLVVNNAEAKLFHGSGTGAGAGFDVVIANILAVVIKKIAPDLLRALSPGGTLVLSGILVDEIAEMKAVFAPDLGVACEWHDSDWAALCLKAYEA